MAKEKLVGKIGYESKNIYRQITSVDSKNTGKVSLKQFEVICTSLNIPMTKDDSQKLAMLFSDEKIVIAGAYAVQQGHTLINYIRMSREMGLHVPSIS